MSKYFFSVLLNVMLFVKRPNSSYNEGMITDELLDFLRTQYASGTPRAELERMLMSEGGWEKADIDQAFLTFGIAVTPEEEVQQVAMPIVEESVAPTRNTPDTIRDVSVSPTIEPQQTFPEVESPKILSVRSERDEPAQVRETSAPAPQTEPTPMIETMEEHQPAHDEDFLGIFSGSAVPDQDKREIQAEPLVEASINQTPIEAPRVVAFLQQPVLEDDSTRVATPTLEATITPEVKRPAILGIMTARAEPRVTQGRSLQDILAQVSAPIAQVATHEQEVGDEDIALDTIEKRDLAAPTASPAVRFDLSRLRSKSEQATPPTLGSKEVILEASPSTPLAEVTKPAVDKPVETISVAELWLNKREAPTTKGPILGKRTMSSDILLRGKGATIQGIPSVSVPDDRPEQGMSLESQTSLEASVEPMQPEAPIAPLPLVQSSESVRVPARTSPADDLSRKQKIKKVIGILVGVLVLLIVVGGGAFVFTFLRSPNVDALFTTTFTKFLSSTSFVYNGNVSSDLVLSAPNDGVVRNGAVKFDLGFGGQVKNGNAGYGDGVHHLKFKGGLQSGSFKWSTDIESDVRMRGNSLYFHVLSFPSETGIDPEVFKTYWIKIDIEEIAKELALSGVATTQQGYGNFGSASKDTTFSALLTKNLPFSGGEKLTDEPASGVTSMHFRLKTDPDKMLALTNALYTKYTGKDLTLDSDQQLRLKNALVKVVTEVWIDPTTNTLEKVALKADFDDDIVGIHVKGKINMNFTFSLFNAPVSVPNPTPLLTLEELQSRMTDFEHTKVARAQDQIKLKLFSSIQDALALYQKDMGRYPTILSELRAGGKLATSTIDDVELKQFHYVSYSKPDLFTKVNKCNAKIKTCTSYHLGVNLNDMADPALSNDSDQTGDINGDDRAGCGNEPNMACYDIAVPQRTTGQ